MKLRIVVSRHSAFYSPLISTIARGFAAEYSMLKPGQRSYELIREGAADIIQSAPSSNWGPMERGISPLPVHFALINRRDGFFLTGRNRENGFRWKDLEGKRLLADHGLQPLTMLRYAVKYNGADWSKINLIDRGAPEEMMAAFRRGEADYIHLQAPGPQILEEQGMGATVVSAGASMPEVAFSSLCCSREFMATQAFTDFLGAYKEARRWVQAADPREGAATQKSYFPDVSQGALKGAIERYQALGTWTGSSRITEDLYRQALRVFDADQPFEMVCDPSV